MLFESWRSVPALTAVFLATTFNLPQPLLAQPAEHVVSPSELQKAVTDASQSRQQNLDTLRGFLSSGQAKQAIESAHMNPQQVTSAVAGLNDNELAQLASRASKAQNDFAAGYIGDHDLLLILVLLAALILIIVAVH
jgi:hypothetical protein